jgi:hypothetical protein
MLSPTGQRQWYRAKVPPGTLTLGEEKRFKQRNKGTPNTQYQVDGHMDLEEFHCAKVIHGDCPRSYPIERKQDMVEEAELLQLTMNSHEMHLGLLKVGVQPRSKANIEGCSMDPSTASLSRN